MKTKQQIPEALRKQLSEAGKRGWKSKIKKAKLQESKVAIIKNPNK